MNIFTYIHVCIHVCMFRYACMSMYVWLGYICMAMYGYVYMYVCMDGCMYVLYVCIDPISKNDSILHPSHKFIPIICRDL